MSSQPSTSTQPQPLTLAALFFAFASLARRQGIIPDLGRTTAFIVIFVMHTLQVIGKAAGVSLLAVTRGKWLL